MDSKDSLLTAKEAAEMLNISIFWMERQRWLGSGPMYLKVGRAVRYRKSDLEKYLSNRGRTSTSEVAK
ncbi:MAG: helix-turn-helix domain-containing protein [Nitrospinae bacterium]|nr:helix-turn-helix domain-containing protein [Nitrospinota bacterium]